MKKHHVLRRHATILNQTAIFQKSHSLTFINYVLKSLFFQMAPFKTKRTIRQTRSN
jgi:hypothetical protein